MRYLGMGRHGLHFVAVRRIRYARFRCLLFTSRPAVPRPTCWCCRACCSTVMASLSFCDAGGRGARNALFSHIGILGARDLAADRHRVQPSHYWRSSNTNFCSSIRWRFRCPISRPLNFLLRLPLPIAFRFFVFHNISLLVDLTRRTEKAPPDLTRVFLYIIFFSAACIRPDHAGPRISCRRSSLNFSPTYR